MERHLRVSLGRIWILILVLVLSDLLFLSPLTGGGNDGGRPKPTQETWSSLWEGDGISPPGSEGWLVRTWGTTSIYSSTSDGETVAIVDDPDFTDGAWMQRWVDFYPPFKLAVRARYDPTSIRTGAVTIADFFTGCHRLSGFLRPSLLRVSGPNSFDVPVTQGTWYNLTYDVKAPLDVDVYLDGILTGNVEMGPVDMVIFDQPPNKPAILTAYSSESLSLAMVDYIRTTMDVVQEADPKVCDREPPLILNLSFDDGVKTPSANLIVSEGIPTVWLNATMDDSTTGNSPIWSANFTQGDANWPGTPMSPTDSQFDSPIEEVSASLDISGFDVGNYTFCVYGRDYYGNSNITGSCGILSIIPPQPPEIRGLVFDDGSQLPSRFLEVPMTPSTVVWINATVDDTLTGNSDILSANFTSGPQAWPGSDMTPADGSYDSSMEEVTGALDVMSLGIGSHSFCVYGADVNGNTNTTGLCGSLNVTLVLPDSHAESLQRYWWNIQPTLQVSVGPGSFDVASVNLLCNHSYDNLTWTGWILCDNTASPPWFFASPFASGEGHYLYYTIARDTQGFEEVAPALADAIGGFDVTPPSSGVSSITPYWRTSQDVDLEASAADALSGVQNVTFLYRFSEDNSSWSDWTSIYTDSAPPFTTMFSASDGDGFYEFNSVAHDLAGNAESDAESDAWVAIDTTPPDTHALPIVPYRRTSVPFVVEAEGEDTLSGLSSIELFYRYSGNNVSWLTWQTLGKSFDPPYEWEFQAPDGEGYYEFHTIGYDILGNQEHPPGLADARMAYIAEAEEPSEGNWKPLLALSFVIMMLIVTSLLIGRGAEETQFSRKARRLMALLILFSTLELLTGLASMFIPALTIPPVLGLGTLVDVLILALGILVLLFVGLRKETELEQPEIVEPPPPE